VRARRPDLCTKEAIRECDICGQDVGNSEKLQQHKEQMHPTDGGEKSIDNVEKPGIELVIALR